MPTIESVRKGGSETYSRYLKKRLGANYLLGQENGFHTGREKGKKKTRGCCAKSEAESIFTSKKRGGGWAL